MLRFSVVVACAPKAAYQQDRKHDASYKAREKANENGGSRKLIAM